jgi:hypothetical protein
MLNYVQMYVYISLKGLLKKKTLMDTLKMTKKWSINLTEIYSNIHFIGEAGIIVCT